MLFRVKESYDTLRYHINRPTRWTKSKASTTFYSLLGHSIPHKVLEDLFKAFKGTGVEFVCITTSEDGVTIVNSPGVKESFSYTLHGRAL